MDNGAEKEGRKYITKDRIAIFLLYMSAGGAQQVIMNLARALLREGFTVDLVLASVETEHMGHIPEGVNVVDLQSKREYRAVTRLSGYLRRERPQVLLSGLHLANEVAILARLLSGADTKVIVMEHSIFSKATKNRTWKKRILLPLCVKYLYRLSDGIIAVSKAVSKDLLRIKGVPEEKVKVIYNMALLEDIYEKAEEPLPHPWFGGNEKPVILAVGRIEPSKDYSTLVRAFAEVRKKMEVRLVILGWGELESRARLEKLAEQLGVKDDVFLPGEVKNPYPYFKQCELFVLSSIYEGLSMSLIEALALGYPVVSTDCQEGPPEVLDGGKFGETIPVRDAKAMEGAILRGLGKGRQEVPKKWLEQFTEKRVMPFYLEIMGFSGREGAERG